MEDKNKEKNKDLEKTKPGEEKREEPELDDKNIIQVKPEDLDKLLKDLKDKYNIKDDQIKIVKYERKKPSRKQGLLQALFTYLLDLVLIVGLLGYIQFARIDLLSVFLLSVIFSTLELIFKYLLMRYFPKLMFSSFGLIAFPITIVSFIIALQIPLGITELDTSKMIFFLIIFMVLRITINVLLMRRHREKLFNKIKGGKK